MTFDEIVSEVILITRRADLGPIASGGDDSIPRFVKRAILQLHTMEFFTRDINSVEVAFDTLAYIQELDVVALPGFRKLSFARKNDNSLATYQQNPTLLPPLYNSVGAINFAESMAFFQVISPDAILDAYNTTINNTCYQAGATLYFRSDFAYQYLQLGYYKFPGLDLLVPGGFSSWIADLYPYAVVVKACSSVFAATGKQDQSRKLDDPRTGEVPQWIQTILINEVEGVAR